MLKQTMAINEYNSFFLPRVNLTIDDLLLQAPMVIANLYISFLILLIILANTIVTLWNSWNLSSPWYRSKQPLGEELLKSALMYPVPGWNSVWRDLGRFLGWLSPLIAREFTPEEANNPNKLAHH